MEAALDRSRRSCSMDCPRWRCVNSGSAGTLAVVAGARHPRWIHLPDRWLRWPRQGPRALDAFPISRRRRREIAPQQLQRVVAVKDPPRLEFAHRVEDFRNVRPRRPAGGKKVTTIEQCHARHHAPFQAVVRRFRDRLARRGNSVLPQTRSRASVRHGRCWHQMA